MKIYLINHSPIEGKTYPEIWAAQKGHFLTKGYIYKEGFVFSSASEIDLLIIAGGLMSVYEEEKFPWIDDEKKYLQKYIEEGKNVLGICFGAQLLANILGAEVKKHKTPDIGWYNIILTEESRNSVYFNTLPGKFKSFVWHYDTFDIPPGGIWLASSKGCTNQAFQYGKNILGLQFHPEYMNKSIDWLIANLGKNLKKSNFVQTAEKILADTSNIQTGNGILKSILDKFEQYRIKNKLRSVILSGTKYFSQMSLF